MKMDRPAKKILVLPNNRERALAQLCNTPQARNKVDEEKKYFLLYLNFAVSNIQQIANTNVTDEKKIADAIKSQKDSDLIIQRLANFLWLFNVDEPGRDFKEYSQSTLMLVEKIFALRNLFAHPAGSDITPLLSDRNFYVMLEGILLKHARDNALAEGLRTDKLYKLKLMNQHSDLKPTDLLFEKNKQYELTRKGIIFLTCLALYKDEAMEFCQLFSDMKLPVRCSAELGSECSNNDCPANPAKPCNFAKAKALISMFTYFSIRKGRDVLDAADTDFMCFADIMTYLNKVPSVAMDYLPLTAEKDMLAKKAESSTESEKNKLFKYALHRRFKDRFLAFAAAYCEDFDLLPCLRFKRLDISETAGRKRYTFGSENDNRNRLDRHYAIKNDSIAFEFIPTEHYGDIKIRAMRGSLTEGEFKNLLYAAKFFGSQSVNDKLQKYFTAYHRILEKMLNAPAGETFYLEDYEQDFAVVTGVHGDDLYENFCEATEKFFPANLTRFFIQESGEMSQEDMYENLLYRLQVLKDHANDFLTRINMLNTWRKQPKEQRKTPRPPAGSAKEIKYAPYSANLTDGDLIAWVFRALNLHLKNEEKFRQLPLGEQHNGARDHEYQMLHAAVGKYSLDQKGFASLLKRNRPALQSVLDDLNSRVDQFFFAALKELKKNPQFDANGRPKKATKTLAMLAQAAAQHCIAYYNSERKKWQNTGVYGADAEVLRSECRRFGVRVGMPLDRNSLIKTILGIDEQKWSYAYNYSAKENYLGRTLDSAEHLFTKLPLPGGFAQRAVPDKFKTGGQEFDFNKALREMTVDFKLRDFYDCAPMVAYTRNGDSSGLNTTREIIRGEEKIIEQLDLSKRAVDKARINLRKCEYQDKLLSIIAVQYRARFMKNESMFEQKVNFDQAVSVYDFFETPITLSVKKTGGILISAMPNDLLRPAFALIRDPRNLLAIAAKIDPSRKEFNYYELQETLRVIQAEDRRKRLEILPDIIAFESKVTLPQNLQYSKNQDKAAREKENRDIQYPYYQMRYRALTRAEFDILADVRNAVYHTGIALDTAEALKLFKKYTASNVNTRR